MRIFIDTAKHLIEKSKNYAYHKGHEQTARKYLKNIEAEKGKLDSKNIKLCKEYAQDVFGDKKYAQWLIVYCTNTREFREGWIPDNYYGDVVVPNMNGAYGKICNRNAAVYNLLKEADSLDICYYVNKLFLNTNNEIISEEYLKKSLFIQNEKVVYKLEGSRQGKGIYFFDAKSFDVALIKKLGNGVFQKYIEQHPFFSEFNDASVATIRITSVCDDSGNLDARASYMKFATTNDTHVKSDTAMYLHIDVKSGILGEKAYFPDWKSTSRLPDNDFSFAGKTIPAFNKCLTEVKKMHSRIPFIRCIGWDVIVDKNNNIKLIELNGGHNGIIINEAFHGPCFKGLNWENLNKMN